MAFFRRNETPAPPPAAAPSAPAVPAAQAVENRKQMHHNLILAYLDSQNWKYTVKDGFMEFGMGIKSKIGNCRIVVVPGEKEIQSYAFCPIKASKDTYANVVEYITRANYGLKVGKFEFDYRDGEVRYQTCLPSRDGTPSLQEVEFIVDLPMLMLQKYGDGLAKNLMGFGDPEKDVAEVEG